MKLPAATDIESLYEASYQAELASWETKDPNFVGYMAIQGPYSKAAVLDVLLIWIPATLALLAGTSAILGFRTDLGTCAPFASVLGVIFADTAMKSQKKASNYMGIGPFGWRAYRSHLAETRGQAPARLDPWSSEAIGKAVAYTRHRLQSEQDAVLQRIWTA
ncbi:hypothetical protein EON81_13975, partial [bacterium]